MVVAPGVTEIEVPFPRKVPPQLPEYHCTTAPVPRAPPTAVSVVDDPAQIDVVPEMEVGATELEFTVTAIEPDVAVPQPAPVHVRTAR